MEAVVTKSYPILFSTPMIRAILEGRKTVTRRIVKNTAREWLVSDQFDPGYVAMRENHLCPYGYTGDTLWVRETWFNDADAGEKPIYVYKADNKEYPLGSCSWKPSIHMPKAASRIFLEITDVKIERLQDISQEDAYAEGILPMPHRPASEGCTQHADSSLIRDCYVCAFRHLWNQINGPLGYPWDKNPWVWAITFKPILK